jgi:Glyoxalase/Bleomycin resistance protein/Dioxygenase superfamily
MQPEGSIIELCHVTRDLDAALRHWTHDLGAGPFFVFEVPVLPGQLYYGEPTEVAMRVGFGFSGGMLIELLQQTNDGASPFRDFLDERGEGLHHVMPRTDFDSGHARLSAAGHRVAFAGMMPSGERFCLFDTCAANGAYVELMADDGPARGNHACLVVFEAEADLEHHLITIDLLLRYRAAHFGHLEPLKVVEGLGRASDRGLDRIFDADAGGANDFDYLGDVVHGWSPDVAGNQPGGGPTVPRSELAATHFGKQLLEIGVARLVRGESAVDGDRRAVDEPALVAGEE